MNTHSRIALYGLIAICLIALWVIGAVSSTEQGREANPDVNHDGIVNLLDIVIVGRNMGNEVADDPEIVALREENAELLKRIGELEASVVDLEATITDLTKPPEVTGIEIVELAVKVTDQNDFFWQFSWQLTLSNNTERDVELDVVKVLFQDNDGFIVDTDLEFGLLLLSNETKTFHGYGLIDTDIAPNVENYSAEIDIW